jgi:undecaprenyl-diphosphatase
VLGVEIHQERKPLPLFASLDLAEVETVARVVSFAERRRLEPVARIATRLGNGWLYPLLSLILAMGPLEAPIRFLVAATLSLLVAFVAYPWLKRMLRRMRPCDYEPALVRDVIPLDRYSCPSGHAMTAAAYGVPLIFACPPAAPFVIAVCGLIGWSRVALGHHYVSDVALGTLLGGAIAAMVGTLLY